MIDLNKISNELSNLTNWQRKLACYCLGAFFIFAFAPWFFIPSLAVSFPCFLLVLWGAKTKRQAFIDGWWFGFGHFSMGLTWLANAFFIDAQRYALLSPVSFLGLGAILAFYPAFVGLADFFIKGHLRKVAFFASLWAFFEWVRSWLFTGFPWNPIGSVWCFSDAMIQICAYIGVYGLSVVTVFGFSLPAIAFFNSEKKVCLKKLLIVSIFSSFCFLSVALFGSYRLSKAENEFYPDVVLRLVQPNIPQKSKWEDKQLEDNFQKYIKISKEKGAEKVTHIIWGETASPFALDRDVVHLVDILNVIPKGGGLITGLVRREYSYDKGLKVWNSLMAVTDKGSWFDFYDKSHLVPFGEYMPLKKILPLEKLSPGQIDFSKGDGLRTLKMPSLPEFSPLICYEIIFSGEVKNKKNRPKWLLNITNDGWYGLSTGPYQHFEISRLRAVEEGLPLVRVANTGISGVVDGYGRKKNIFPLNLAGFLDCNLPKPISKETPFSRHGNKIPLSIIVILPLLCELFKKISRRLCKPRLQ